VGLLTFDRRRKGAAKGELTIAPRRCSQAPIR